MTPDAAERLRVYQEGQRSRNDNNPYSDSDWRSRTWIKGRVAAKEYREQLRSEDTFQESVMNEKIKQLAEQAGMTWSDPYDFWAAHNEEIELFVELIVSECCEVLREEVEVALSADGDVVYPEGLIRKHFGVSE